MGSFEKIRHPDAHTFKRAVLCQRSASTHCLSLLQILNAHIGADMCMDMELMVLTYQATCFGLAEDLVATSGSWILGLAGFLTRQGLTFRAFL